MGLPPERRTPTLKGIAIGLFLWAIVDVVALGQVAPWHPTSPRDWVLFALLGAPAMVLAEGLGEWIVTAASSLTTRLGYVVLILVGLAIVLGGGWLAVQFGVVPAPW